MENLPFKELTGLELSPELIQTIPREIVVKHCIVPIHIDQENLTIALSDQTNTAALDDISFFIGHDVKLILAEKDAIESIIRKHYPDDSVLSNSAQLSIFSVSELTKPNLNYDDDVIVDVVNSVISDGLRLNASDILVEPLERRLRVRYRIDGFCHEINSFPNELKPAITSRAKVIAGMDLAEKRLPQDGRIITQVNGKDINIRVSTLPVAYGESIVLRILDTSNINKGLSQSGLLEEDYKQLLSIVSVPDGMIIISGPTGSGKTTTLYGILSEILKPSIKIITIEDPVEYTIDGINQIQIQSEDGRGFGSVLKHILRHDPDVIMVGEMRDRESVEIAMRSSLTGHKVLSTLHTNDAPSVINRFINMGVEPYMINASVQAAIYQRLVRTLCLKCKEPSPLSRKEMASLINRTVMANDRCHGDVGSVGNTGAGGSRQGKIRINEDWNMQMIEDEFKRFIDSNLSHINQSNNYVFDEITWFKPVGCKHCNFSGYKGRTAIFEIMLMNDSIKQLTMKKAPSAVIRRRALNSGMRDIRIDGVLKAMKGITTISEALRVT